jgi:hypothetical protein
MLSAAVLMSALPIGLAQAAPISSQGIGAAVEEQSVIDHVQYRWAGAEYCWYDDGWRGPGFYRCGFRLRVGQGWGGPAGWHGWRGAGAEFRGRDRVGVERRGGVEVERGRVGFEERGRVGAERRGSVETRGRIGIEERSRAGSEGRARVGTEQRGRIGVEGGTTGRSGAGATTSGARERSGGGADMTSGGRGGER